jgi:hypothetical protein
VRCPHALPLLLLLLQFLGAVGTLTSTIIGTQGALVLKLDVPVKQCFYN